MHRERTAVLLAWLALLAAHAQDSQRAAAAKQGGLQNVTVATSTRSSVRRKRTVVTSTKVCSAVEVVHATVSARRQSSASTYASVVSQCHKLHPDVFWECGRPREWLQAHRPCTDHAFVAKIRDAYVADNRVHQAVPGTVFTDNFVFRWQAYVRDVPDGSPSEWPDPPKVHSYACLASALQAYPVAKGHFAHEVMPRLLYLMHHIPANCHVLAAVNGFVQRFLSLLPKELSSRVLPWAGAGHVYFASTLYVANEGPFCDIPNPHSGGMSTFFLPEVVTLVRRHFVARPHLVFSTTTAAAAGEESAPYAVVMERRAGGARAYSQHAQLVAELRAHCNHTATHCLHVVEFRAEGSLREHVALFSSAAAVLGPHGAGFANLVFCSPGTRVVEIGWYSQAVDADGMEMDDMYFRLSVALGLEYRLVLGTGSYTGPISADPVHVLKLGGLHPSGPLEHGLGQEQGRQGQGDSSYAGDKGLDIGGQEGEVSNQRVGPRAAPAAPAAPQGPSDVGVRSRGAGAHGCQELEVDASDKFPSVRALGQVGLGGGGLSYLVLDFCLKVGLRRGKRSDDAASVMRPDVHTQRDSNAGGELGGIRVVEGGKLILHQLVLHGPGTAAQGCTGREGGGGAVFEIDGGRAEFSDCSFRGYATSVVSYVGVQVRVLSGAFACSNCSFVSNAAATQCAGETWGGALQALGGTVVLSRSLFANNSATGGGGAVYISGGDVRIRHCVFDSNFVVRSGQPVPGGAWKTEGEGAGMCGGAILIVYAARSGGEMNVSAVSSTLRRNRAPAGGGVCVRAGCAPAQSGSACSASGMPADADAEAEGPSGLSSGAKGGGVAAVDLLELKVEGNTAIQQGGGLAWEGWEGQPTSADCECTRDDGHCRLQGGPAAAVVGARAARAMRLSIRDSFFGANIAGRGGGAFLLGGNDGPIVGGGATVSGCHFWRNVATDQGGGLFLAGGRGRVRRSVLDGNEAWVAADNVRISRTEHAAREKTPGTRRSKGEGWRKPRADAEGAKWTIDEASTVSRLACSAPPPTPLHPQPPRPAPRIFVSIVSYRDPECARTVLDLFLSAAQPERLSVGLVQQHATWHQHRAGGQGAAEFAGGADGDCMDLVDSVAPEFGAQVRRVVMRPEEARGPVLARNLSRGLYAGEHYALSIDSHMRFGCEWDSRLVALLLALNHSRALVTAYPPNYSPMQGLQHAAKIEPSRLVALGFDDLDALAPDAPAPASDLDAVGGARAHGKRQSDRHWQAADQQTRVKILRIGSRLVPAEECARREVGAVGSLFWAAGFNFGRGTAVLEVPYDAHLEDLFFGEEMLMSLLLWRSGYAFFAPCDASMLWHQWSRAGRPTFWEQRRSTRPPAATLHRLHAALLSNAAQPGGTQRAPGGGGRRAGRAYEEFANISFGCGVAGPRARAGLSPVWRP